MPGFYGYSESGRIATFGRNGSDLTGAYIAGALAADVYENFTDTDGIYSASSALVPDPRRSAR